MRSIQNPGHKMGKRNEQEEVKEIKIRWKRNFGAGACPQIKADSMVFSQTGIWERD